MIKFIAFLGALAIALPGVTLAAQTEGSQAATPGVTIAPDQPKSGKSADLAKQDKTLAQTLSRTNGTITPPPVDPGMAKTPPKSEQGTMPIVHPPPNVKSK